MNPRLHEISRTRYTWSNATSNVEVTPLRYFYPETVEDIKEIISEAENQGLKVRAVGSGHSFSEAAKGKDFLMDMKHLKNADVYSDVVVKPEFNGKHFMLTDAGITIRRLNRKLNELNLALSNMGAVDFQTVSGALSTGTHGTGIAKPAFPDMVRAIRIVGTNGKQTQIEPTNGITDPVKHQEECGIELIQDDSHFYSTVLCFGAMGIIYQLVFEVEPSYWMKERRYLQNWSELKQEFLNGTFMQKVEDNDFVAFRANPYKIKGDHLCSIVVQNKLADNPSMIKKAGRNFLGTIASNMESLIESTIQSLNKKPQKTGKRIQTSLKFSKVINYTDKSYKVLYQSGAAVLRYGISSEFAFPATAEKIVEVLDDIFEQNAHMNAYANLYQSSHIPVRFVMPSKAYLSSAYERKTAYVDVPMLHTTIGDFEILERYQNKMMQLGGIPHWGKINNMLYANNDFVYANYPKWQDWVNIRKVMDPDGTFLNDFIIQMGLE